MPEEQKRLIDAWRARPAMSGETISSSSEKQPLDPDSPEAAAAAYLDALAARNFGSVARWTVDYPLRTIAWRAGRVRDDVGKLHLVGWEITGVTDQAPAISVVTVQLTGTYDGGEWSGEQTMRMIYGDEEYNAVTRGAEGGSWSVMPMFLSNLWATLIRSVQKRNGLAIDDDDT